MSDLSFYQAQFTAVISDLHLCDAEPVNVKTRFGKNLKPDNSFLTTPSQLFLFI